MDLSGWNVEIVQVVTESGETVTDFDDDTFAESDEIFYKVVSPDGEEFYRYIYGPYDNEADVIDGIHSEIDFYEELASAS
jgi:hypothetical protein